MSSGETGEPTDRPDRHAALLAHTSDAVFTLAGGVVSSWNPAAARLLGRPAERAVGRPVADVLRPDGDDEGWDAFLALVADPPREAGGVDLRCVHPVDGARALSGVLWSDDDDQSTCVVLLRDAVAPRLAEELRREREQLAADATELWHRAFHDPLTNLANRNLFRQRAEHLLGRAPGRLLAVLLFDLDGFNAVNDALGHAVGDRLIVQVAARLRACVRDRDTVARPGGDQFAILLDDVAGEEDAAQVARSVVDSLAEAFEVDGRVVGLSTSVGIVVAPGGRGDVDALLRDADVTLHQAKARGRGTFAYFEGTMHTAALARLELEEDLRRAVEQGGLSVHYQPVANLRSGTVVCVEALARWDHPVRGSVGPAEFIPVAEETGLIVALGDWVLRESCGQARTWHQRYPDHPPVAVAVNLSGIQLQLPQFSQSVAAVLEETGLPADLLVLEITESQIMENMAPVVANLRELQALGVRLSIDDFGTGYSSLARLRTLPVDELKIDRSFVQEIDAGGDAPLVAAIVAMGHSLDLHVVGEGVETAGQLDVLLRARCDRAQGYLLGRPAPADAVEELITQPILVLRLAAAAAALGDAAPPLDVDVIEALGSVLAEADDRERFMVGMLGLVARVTGLEVAYATRFDWERQELEVMQVHGDCSLTSGARFSWAGASTPDFYVDARLIEADGLETYISVPVIGAHSGLLGTLCAAGRERRVLSRTQLGALEVLARIMGEQLSRLHDDQRIRLAL